MPRTPSPDLHASASAGFALLEVLLAMLALSMAAAGLAGMQLTALRASQQSALQSTAAHLAADIADTLRAAGLPIEQVLYDSRDAGAGAGVAAAPATSCLLTGCSPAAWLLFQQAEWTQRVRDTLPGGRILVCADRLAAAAGAAGTGGAGGTGNAAMWACSGGALVVKVGWREPPLAGRTAAPPAGGAPDAPQLVMQVGL